MPVRATIVLRAENFLIRKMSIKRVLEGLATKQDYSSYG